MAAATSGDEPSAAAAVASTDPDTQAVVEARNNCVVCGTVQPADGKLLRCLHVVCRECLKESMSQQGSVKCLQCPELLTTSRIAGVDLADQLMDCCPLLYGGSNTTFGRSTPDTDLNRLNCNMCEGDEDLSREATHVCNDCNGLPLCDEHAGKHLKARFSSSHQVTDVNPSKALVAQPRHRCVLHCQFDVNLYCQTCKQSLCQKCLEDEHRGHMMDSIAAARVDLDVMICDQKAKLSTICGASTGSARNAVNHRIAEVSKAIEKLEGDGKTASKIITDTFDEVERLVQRAREHCLSEADRLVWEQLDPLQKQRRELRQLKQKEAMIQHLIDCVVADPDPLKVLSFSQEIGANISLLEQLLGRVGGTPSLRTVSAKAKESDDIEAAVKSMISVSDTSDSLSADTLSMLEQLSKLPLASAADISDDDDFDYEGPWTLLPSGMPVRRIVFDRDAHTQGIELGCSYRSAEQSEVDDYSCAFAADGYTSGCWSWQVKVFNPIVQSRSGKSSYSLEVGVSQLCWEQNQPAMSSHYGNSWSGDGRAWRGQDVVSPAEMSTWKDGHILMFTLDCDRQELTCLNRSTLESRFIKNIDCSTKLYPVVGLRRPGMRALLC